ncbi:MAG: bifunctional methylenetetrahydrofolate dehydrogenase/methenyltetrahydrofolate cyclohydrolase FolD [Verrucomicrobia bacterium]|nr:bifunctional methylenetetrahydrofolate dehydrogenase/methenyltetrahydrofolate cyclohydrolase FolD [Verrucomicrobiota bacterium]
MKILDGKHVAAKVEHELKRTIGTFVRPPGLAFILVGENPASHTYVRMKKKKCQDVGIASFDKIFRQDASEKEVLAHIEHLNRDPLVDGILIQLPLPSHLSTQKVLSAIDPGKDVDGLHPCNFGKLLLGETDGFIPCTPLGIQTLLKAYEIKTAGKHVVIVGRSNIVGKPLAALLMQKKEGANATVTIAHSATHHLKEITKSADILVAAMGHPLSITADMVKLKSVVIDVGINRVGGRIAGDVDYEAVAPLVSAITPVPGGVGPMTIAMLMSNVVQSYETKLSSKK